MRWKEKIVSRCIYAAMARMQTLRTLPFGAISPSCCVVLEGPKMWVDVTVGKPCSTEDRSQTVGDWMERSRISLHRVRGQSSWRLAEKGAGQVATRNAVTEHGISVSMGMRTTLRWLSMLSMEDSHCEFFDGFSANLGTWSNSGIENDRKVNSKKEMQASCFSGPINHCGVGG